tara:strand:+ start:276 stop:563 length:288 start_codon:yes stop_codon:yes gene_type:complete
MWLTLFIIFLLISIVSSITLFYALKRINQYETFILQFERIIKLSTEKMKKVDASGHYESDDETQFFFDELKAIQNLLDNIFESESNQEKNDETTD